MIYWWIGGAALGAVIIFSLIYYIILLHYSKFLLKTKQEASDQILEFVNEGRKQINGEIKRLEPKKARRGKSADNDHTDVLVRMEEWILIKKKFSELRGFLTEKDEAFMELFFHKDTKFPEREVDARNGVKNAITKAFVVPYELYAAVKDIEKRGNASILKQHYGDLLALTK